MSQNIRPGLKTIIADMAHGPRKPAKLQSVVYDGNVRQQSAPYYEVQHKGTVIEFTDKRSEAFDAWKLDRKVTRVIRIDLVGNRAIRREMQFN